MKSTYTHNVVIHIKTYLRSNSTNIDLRGLISYSLFSRTMYTAIVDGKKSFLQRRYMRLSAAPDDSFKGMNILRQNIYRLLCVRNRRLNYIMNISEDNCIHLYSDN